MIYVYDVLLVAHFLGWAMVLGSWIGSLKSGQLSSGVFHGAATACLSGFLAFILTVPTDGVEIELSAAKMITKLTLTLAVTALAWIATHGRNGEAPPKWAATVMGALTLTTIVVAVFWR